jgi:hypothetical protein
LYAQYASRERRGAYLLVADAMRERGMALKALAASSMVRVE